MDFHEMNERAAASAFTRTTEAANRSFAHLDECSTMEVLSIINEQDALVPLAVGKVLPDIGRAVDVLTERLKAGGKMLYVGAGTSGRLGMLDAYECPPTYGTCPELVQACIAGAELAMQSAVEDGEDDREEGRRAVERVGISQNDVVVGITASGSTPYVISAIGAAKARGAATILVTNNEHVPSAHLFEVIIAPVVGPEVIVGSTRMKAGTAQKMVLNMLTTCTMIRLGKTYGGHMVDMRPTNAKLRERAARIVREIAGCDEASARAALETSDWNIKRAILKQKYRLDDARACALLDAHGGNLRQSMRAMEGHAPCDM